MTQKRCVVAAAAAVVFVSCVPTRGVKRAVDAELLQRLIASRYSTSTRSR